MSRRNCLQAAFAAALLCLALCGKKPPAAPAIVFGADSLAAGQVAGYDPSISSDSVRLRAVALRIVCAGALPDSSVDSMALRLAEQLLLVSNVEWNAAAAALLLNAAKQLSVHFEMADPCSVLRAAADSLLQLSTKAIRSGNAAAGWKVFECDSADLTTQSGKAWFLRTLLFVSPEIADLLMEFVGVPPPADGTDSADFKKMVAGLVSSPEDIRKEELRRKAAAMKVASRGTSAAIPDNSAAVLRYRDQKSIRDSIEKHIPDLKQLYKKNLKMNSSLAGNVVVTIRVGAGGSVLSADVKTSDIGSRAFLDPLTVYIKTIRFKPVPEKVGAMTFDFPFEFNPEM